MSNNIYRGGTADVETKCRNRSGDFVNPGGLAFTVSVDGSNIGTVAVHGVGSIIENVSTGIFVGHLVASWAGRWLVRAIATGPQEVDEHTFDVLP